MKVVRTYSGEALFVIRVGLEKVCEVPDVRTMPASFADASLALT